MVDLQYLSIKELCTARDAFNALKVLQITALPISIYSSMIQDELDKRDQTKVQTLNLRGTLI